MLKWRRIYWHTQCKNWCLQVRKCWKWKIGNKCHAQMMCYVVAVVFAGVQSSECRLKCILDTFFKSNNQVFVWRKKSSLYIVDLVKGVVINLSIKNIMICVASFGTSPHFDFSAKDGLLQCLEWYLVKNKENTH